MQKRPENSKLKGSFLQANVLLLIEIVNKTSFMDDRCECFKGLANKHV